jgi:hypothetical protein
MKRLTQEEFINRAIAIHGNKYDYSKVVYVNSTTDVCIICPIHGEFWQTPSGHLQGRGCKDCWSERFSKATKGKPKVSTRKMLFGVAYVDVDYAVCKTNAYVVWCDMLRRCYSEKYHKKKPTYKGCSVCEEWLLFSNFKRWFDENHIDGYVLDKDILVKGNKVYSPDACCFVPNDLNVMVKSSGVERDLPTGVYLLKSGRYYASYNNHTAGTYDTVNDAYNAYCKCKEKDVKKRSQDYYEKGLITEKVYNALQKYKVKQYNI